MKAASILSDSYSTYKDYLIELKDIDIISVNPLFYRLILIELN